MRLLRRPAGIRYGLAVASVAVILLVKLLLDRVFGEGPPLILLLAAVMVAAWYGGPKPGLLALAISVLACGFFVFEPFHSLRIGGAPDGLRLAVFIVEGALICALMAELHGARRRAELANQSKDHFLAALSHELRTPLTPVLLTTTALLDDPETGPELRLALERIRQNVELGARLMDDLLDVARISRGKMTLHRDVVDAHVLIHRTLGLCRHELEAKHHRLGLDLAAAAHHVRADPARLQQVLWNLLKNAIKFTPPGGTITLSSRDDPDGRLVLQVADSGKGIEPEALPRIFDAFEQGGDLMTRRYGGLGLGLAIGRSIIEAHGGSLSAASAGKNRGATFTLRLATTAPASPVDASAGPPTPRRTREALRPRILLVEDDTLTATLLVAIFREKGYEVTLAGGFAEALEVPPGDYDLVVSDIWLTDGSGLDLMQQLRARRDVPGIALTGFGTEDDIRKSRRAGFVAHLTKPIDFPKLDALIQEVAPAPPARGTTRPMAEVGSAGGGHGWSR
jgi:signal transduction histidine kinase/CheY-like chemotaxis protein